MADLAEGVIGFEAMGELHASDYSDVLSPAVRKVGSEARKSGS